MTLSAKSTNQFVHLLSILVLSSILAACSAAPQEPETIVANTIEPSIVPTDEPTPAPEIEVPTVAPTIEVIVAEATSEPTLEPTPAPTATLAPAIETIEVTYFTESQQEGPYYPTQKLDDQDNDLIEVAGQTDRPAGNELLLEGIIYDATGTPLSGVQIEIWQTDANGVYLHPQDPTTESRDRNFQFYGEAITAADGSYFFRTIVPGKYEPRPVHIHFKVRVEGQEVLTSQMYFPDDTTAQGQDSSVFIEVTSENDVFLGTRDVILRNEYPAFHAVTSGN